MTPTFHLSWLLVAFAPVRFVRRPVAYQVFFFFGSLVPARLVSLDLLEVGVLSLSTQTMGLGPEIIFFPFSRRCCQSARFLVSRKGCPWYQLVFIRVPKHVCSCWLFAEFREPSSHRTRGITTVLYEYILVCAQGFPDLCLHINFIAGFGSLSEKYLQWY